MGVYRRVDGEAEYGNFGLGRKIGICWAAPWRMDTKYEAVARMESQEGSGAGGVLQWRYELGSTLYLRVPDPDESGVNFQSALKTRADVGLGFGGADEQ